MALLVGGALWLRSAGKEPDDPQNLESPLAESGRESAQRGLTVVGADAAVGEAGAASVASSARLQKTEALLQELLREGQDENGTDVSAEAQRRLEDALRQLEQARRQDGLSPPENPGTP
ncbi:MAG: hypothetical protein AAGF12_15965 [Myxococcota bacterium]